jgi:hypothetical protein
MGESVVTLQTFPVIEEVQDPTSGDVSEGEGRRRRQTKRSPFVQMNRMSVRSTLVASIGTQIQFGAVVFCVVGSIIASESRQVVCGLVSTHTTISIIISQSLSSSCFKLFALASGTRSSRT